MIAKSVSDKRNRFPPEIIARMVWLYFRFPLSLRLVEEMRLERGIVVSCETAPTCIQMPMNEIASLTAEVIANLDHHSLDNPSGDARQM